MFLDTQDYWVCPIFTSSSNAFRCRYACATSRYVNIKSRWSITKLYLSSYVVLILLFLFSIGVIYLKNLISQNWADREGEPSTPLPFTIHEQDRAMIRDAIVDAVVHAPELIR